MEEKNIEVIVRCRPFSSDELRSMNRRSIVECKSTNVEIDSKRPRDPRRTYAFDRVLDETCTQELLFNQIINDKVLSTLNGFNVTIFAYGQTGTGKTYTMQGVIGNPEHEGIIPRAMRLIFERLERTDCEFTVSVSFLEIYNEKLNDLLSDNKAEIRIIESDRGIVCSNLSEIPVGSMEDIPKILKYAISRRQTASTQMNATSSRSHSLFMVTTQIKELTSEGEEIIKTGKLNLVDLAGSESIGRSDPQGDRILETKNINKSLLTLGRVISALVDHSQHIPYRESKLTRLLQESLGGGAYSCIIATITPSIMAIDQTISTLDYAIRAKSIKNRPTLNQKVSKKALMKNLVTEIKDLEQQLKTQIDMSGIYIPEDKFNELQV